MIIAGIESLPPKAKDFNAWAFIQRCLNQGLPTEAGISILLQIKQRWVEIREVWAYAQDVLRKEYQQYRIDLAIKEHETLKREPARIGEIMAEAQRKAGTPNAEGEKPW